MKLRDARAVQDGGIFIAPPGMPPEQILHTSADALILSAFDYRNVYAQFLLANGWKSTPLFFPSDLLHPEPTEALWVAKKQQN